MSSCMPAIARACISPNNCPFARGIWAPYNTCFLGPTRDHNPNGISVCSVVFAQMTEECPYTLQWDDPSLLKIALSHGGSGPPSNTWFPGPTRVLNLNGISIGSAVFAGLTRVTDRQTDRPTNRPRYSIGNNRPHLLRMGDAA